MKHILLTLIILALAVPAFGQDNLSALEQAVQNIESAIHDAMSRAGQQGQPTLGQLGGVQSGSTGSDAGGSSGGSSSSGASGGGSGGPGGGSPGS